MSNEPIEPIEQNYIPYETLFPNAVIGGVEVNDSISSPTKTYSSEKIEDRLDQVSSSLTQAIENIDLSPYATTQALTDGLSIKQNLLFDGDFLEFSPKNGYFYSDSFLQNATPNIGNIVATTASNGVATANLVLMNAISSTQISRPSAGITSNLQGSAVLRYTRVSCRIGAGCTIQQETHVSFRSFTATGYTSIYIGLDSIGTATSIPANDVLTGSGLFWRWNPTLNSGKLQLVKCISGVITVLLNTNYSITDDIIYKFGIKYIKSTDTAYFYYDRVLIHTQSTINLPNNIELYDVIAVNTSNSQAVNKLIHWHQINGLIKYA